MVCCPFPHQGSLVSQPHHAFQKSLLQTLKASSTSKKETVCHLSETLLITSNHACIIYPLTAFWATMVKPGGAIFSVPDKQRFSVAPMSDPWGQDATLQATSVVCDTDLQASDTRTRLVPSQTNMCNCPQLHFHQPHDHCTENDAAVSLGSIN